METESSQVNQARQGARTACAESTCSRRVQDRTEDDDAWDESRNAEETSRTSSMANKRENMMENLQDRLTTMRDGFLER